MAGRRLQQVAAAPAAGQARVGRLHPQATTAAGGTTEAGHRSADRPPA
jgi:hypothetical protein